MHANSYAYRTEEPEGVSIFHSQLLRTQKFDSSPRADLPRDPVKAQLQTSMFYTADVAHTPDQRSEVISVDAARTQDQWSQLIDYVVRRLNCIRVKPNYKFVFWLPSDPSIKPEQASLQEIDLQTLEKSYKIIEPERVFEFLKERQYLLPLLLEAREEILKYFPQSSLSLELKADPEAEDNSQLILYIQTNLPFKEALDQLDKFDEQWWLDKVDQAKGNLCIDLAFK